VPKTSLSAAGSAASETCSTVVPGGPGLTAGRQGVLARVADAGMVTVAVKPLPLVLRCTATLRFWPSSVAVGFPVGHLVTLMVTV
jgi:hypothetical protein